MNKLFDNAFLFSVWYLSLIIIFISGVLVVRLTLGGLSSFLTVLLAVLIFFIGAYINYKVLDKFGGQNENNNI